MSRTEDASKIPSAFLDGLPAELPAELPDENSAPLPPAAIRLDVLLLGGLRPLPPEGQISGIFKQPTNARVMLGIEGLLGDQQGDRRNHGGPDKAVHHFPLEHYAALAARFSDCAVPLAPGVLGENFSTQGLNEHNVCIGDVFALGPARLQVSQPRQPCWKIDHRLGQSTASRYVAEAGITGWYYRVLESGEIAAGMWLELRERPNPWLSLAAYWQARRSHRIAPQLLQRIAAAPGLAADKALAMAERAQWLRNESALNPGQETLREE